jgi:erythritol transport system ATP-binding protein
VDRGFLRRGSIIDTCKRWMQGYDVRPQAPLLEATSFSGGNQQKLVLARAAMSRPRVLLMDEPTRGVDVAAKLEIVESMRRLAGEGAGVLFASSDLAEVQAAATRVLAMARGRITADLDASQASAEALASAASRPSEGPGA